ncbi:MAG TPA: sigma-70 family RNA polymerase sigma factor [Cellvibrionaceae bacterium]
MELAALYQQEAPRVLASLVRLLGDFDLAEEALQEAFVAAISQWERDGVPHNPRAWLVSAGRFKAIDAIRRKARFEPLDEALAATLVAKETTEPQVLEDDLLRLIFTCCHPSLNPEAQLALTLREVCGLTTEALARAFFVSPSTMAQRIVRAKQKIKAAKIPYEIPERSEIAQRLDVVLQVVYLLYNEGYKSTGGADLVRRDLAQQAIALCQALWQLLPEAEVGGLLSLMQLQEARALSRQDEAGRLMRLEEQDRSLWDVNAIGTAAARVRHCLSLTPAGPYCLQAAIAACHAEAKTFALTPWAEITGLYHALWQQQPTAVIALNHAVALAYWQGPQEGLAALAPIAPQLKDYYLFYAARAQLYEQCGETAQAAGEYQAALELAPSAPEAQFLAECLARLGG